MKVVMSEEYRRKMRGLMPIAEASVHKFVPRSILDRGLTEEEMQYAPRVFAKQFTNKQAIALKQYITDNAARSVASRKRAEAGEAVEIFDERKDLLAIIGDSVVGWENFYDLTGEEPVEMKCNKKNLSLLPEPILYDIVNELAELSGVLIRFNKAVEQAVRDELAAEAEIKKNAMASIKKAARAEIKAAILAEEESAADE